MICLFLSDSASPATSQSSDFGTWIPDGSSGNAMNSVTSGWGAPSSLGGEIIVDSQDKETWPSIGDRSSESASECGDVDNASVKSGSVISSSSNPGQGHSDNGQGQSQSAIQGQGSSSVWGSSAYGIGEEKMDSVSNWGSNPGVLGDSAVWGTPSPNSTASPSNMQSSNPTAVSSAMQTSNANNSLGWAMNNGQNSTSGAQASSNGQMLGRDTLAQRDAGFSSDMGNAMLQGIGGLSSSLQKPESSAWNLPGSSSVIQSSSLSISQASPGPSLTSRPATSGVTDQWGQPGGSSSPAPAGWGEPDPTAVTESTGWGEPDPTPIANAGTEGWGAPDTQSRPRQAWGEADRVPAASSWGQGGNKTPGGSAGGDVGAPPGPGGSGGWDQPTPKPPAPVGGWGEPEQPKPAGWAPNEPQRGATPAWGAPGDDKPNPQSQWGAANPQQSQWGSAQPPNSAQGAWGSTNNPPRPIGSQPAPPPPPPQTSQQQPMPSFAQAAGRGLPPVKPSPPSQPGRITKDTFINHVVNSHEGWGKTPIRQDTSWDSVEMAPRPAPPKPTSSQGAIQDDPNTFHQPNNGTAIWEASKENTAGQWGNNGGGGGGGGGGSGHSGHSNNSGASGSSNEWQSDNDSGTWNGPPGQESNMWNGPPNNNNARWGGGGSSSSGSSGGGYGNKTTSTWGASSSDNHNHAHPHPHPHQWEDKPKQWEGNRRKDSFTEKGGDDNVWDRDGTGVWGDPGKGAKTETGTWQAPPPRRTNSGSWGSAGSDEPHHHHHPPGWGGDNQNPNQGSVDDGTAYWGDPAPQPKPVKQWSSQPQPGGQPITGQRPPDDKGPPGWGNPSQPSKNSGWGDPSPPAKSLDDGTAMWTQPNQGQVSDFPYLPTTMHHTTVTILLSPPHCHPSQSIETSGLIYVWHNMIHLASSYIRLV